jgi:hypothetical protein
LLNKIGGLWGSTVRIMGLLRTVRNRQTGSQKQAFSGTRFPDSEFDSNRQHDSTRVLRRPRSFFLRRTESRTSSGVMLLEPALSVSAHVRLGSEADISLSPTNVRFTPESGHR